MSNVDIDLIYGQEAIKQVEVMSAKLAENVAQVEKITAAASAMNKAMGASSKGGVKDQIKDVDLLARANKQLEIANSDLGKQIAQVREATRQLNTENRLSAKENLAVESSYDKLNAQVEKMKLAYKKMAEEQRESTAEGKKLAAQIDIQTNKLKALDSTMGVHNRHVGDYKNQLKDLGAQIQKNVLEYNALSAAQKKSDVGTAMKANIMNLGDTYRNLATGTTTASSSLLTFDKVIAKAPSQLDKVAKGVGSVWSVIRQAAYILPGLGIAGIMGIAVEGVGMLIELVSGLNMKLTESEKELMKIRVESQKSISNEIANAKLLLDIATNANLRYNEREQAYKKLQDLYPDYLQNMTAEKALGGDLILNYEGLSLAIERTAKKRAQLSALESAMAKEAQAQAKLDLMNKPDDGKTFYYYTQAQKDEAEGKLAAQQDLVNEIRRQIQLQEEIERGAIAISDEVRKAQELSYKQGGKNKKPDSPKKVADINRITLLQDEYESDLLVQRKASDSEQDFRFRQLQIIEDYSNNRVKLITNLSDAEEKSLVSLENKWLDSTEKLAKENEKDQKDRLKLLDEQVDSFTKAQDDELKALSDRYKKEAKEREDAAKKKEKEREEEIALNKKYWDQWVNIGQASMSLVESISDGIYARQQQRLDQKEKSLKNYYDNEKRFIEDSGLSASQKERSTNKLEAETEAKRKQIDRDRITALRKQATFNKILTISEVTLETTIAVLRALSDKSVPNFYLRALNAAAAGAAGAAQIARAAAVTLPQYAKGRKGGKAEWAVTNEQGAELHITKEGKAYIPNEGKMGTTFLEEDTTVLPADITKQIMSASYITLAQATQGKTEALQLALLEKTDKEIIELIGLRKDLRAKEMSTTFNNNTGFEAWKNIHIR